MNEERNGGLFVSWWRQEIANRSSGAAKALRARLRRAGSSVEILMEPSVHRLALELNVGQGQTSRICSLCAVVQVLANVETDKPGPSGTAAHLFGFNPGKDRPVLSQMRFQRIIRTTNADDVAPMLIRALPLIERACNVDRLGGDIFYWSERVRNRWCFEYFGGSASSTGAITERTKA